MWGTLALAAGIIFATLWNSEEKHFEGMLTITDFIDMLLHFHHEPDTITVMKQLENHRIKTWRAMGSRKRPQKLVFISPDHTLLDAVQVLITNRIHRLPLIHETALLNIMTYEAILEFLHYNVRSCLPISCCEDGCWPPTFF